MRKITPKICAGCRAGNHGSCDLTFLKNIFPNTKDHSGGESDICSCDWPHKDKSKEEKVEEISES